MKKLVLIVLSVSISLIAKADAWDNLSKDEADNVVAFINENPFVFDYCDCCGSGAKLIWVESTEIVPCSWQPEDYTVKYKGTAIASFFIESRGVDPNNVTVLNESFEGDVYMNYTWVYNKQFRVVAPFFESIRYTYYGNDNTSCQGLFGLPKAKLIKNKAYTKWSKKL